MRKFLLSFILLYLVSIDAFALKERVLPEWATVIDYLQEGYVIKTASNHYGVLNLKYNIVIDTVWDNYGGRNNFYWRKRTDVIYLKKNENTIYNDSCHGGWMLLDIKGKPIINYEFRLPFDLEGVQSYYGHQLGVFQSETGKWGLCNKSFTVVQPPIYDAIWVMVPDTHFLYGDNSFLVKFNGKYGIVDTSGRLSVDTIYTAAYRPDDAFVLLANAKDTLYFHEGAVTKCHGCFLFYDPGTPKLTGRLITNIKLQYFMQYCPYDYYGNYIYLKDRSGAAGDLYRNCIPEYGLDPRFQYHAFVEETDYLSFTYGFFYEDLHKHKPYEWRNYKLDTSLIVSNDSLLCMNYSIRNGKTYSITLDSLFCNKDSLAQVVKQNIMKANKDFEFTSPDALQLTEKFMILPQGVELIFSVKNGEKTSYYSQVMPWKNLEGFIDPRGPLRNKLPEDKQ